VVKTENASVCNSRKMRSKYRKKILFHVCDLFALILIDPFQCPWRKIFRGIFRAPQTFLYTVEIVTKSISGFEL